MERLKQSIQVAINSREARGNQTLPILPSSEREALIATYHPDSRADAYRTLKTGPNAGERTVHEVAELLEAESSVDVETDLIPAHEVDVLVVGGGGAGSTAALTCKEMGANVLLVTKLRLGDSNTVMAQGGMQVAIGENDSPVTHFKDTMRGGHYKNDPDILRTLVENSPKAAQWLMNLGVLF